MVETDRRSFLKLMGTGALAAALPDGIRKASAVSPRYRTGTIRDVEHVVILTQENRSFDHYFGTMRGVRGFADPRAVKLPNGRPVWHQPNGAGELLPYRPDVRDLGRSFLPDPPHGWNDGHAAWNGGRYDAWVPNKGIVTMTYNTRDDIPFHYALADAFTICDAYHCSVMGPTDPNRYHLWTGWVGNDGTKGGPVITNAEAGYDWSTYPERLQRNGVSWKVYQDIGVGLDAPGFWGWTGDQPYIGNYGDNSLLYFHQFQDAPAGSPLANGAKVGTNIAKGGTLFDQFRADVQHDRLPQVSWIAAPEALSEHPNWAPDFGAWYVSQIVDILASNPDVFAKTVFFLNYDEEGGFFDHMVPPTPAFSPQTGASTVDPVNERYSSGGGHPDGPYGLGVRVPMIIVSPWTKGGWVNSQVFDHTSVIKFLEARFADGNPDLIESNITPWRRAVVGDLTSAFDFTRRDGRSVRLPSTAADQPPDAAFYPDLALMAPAKGSRPAQERGVKPARALPYTLHAHATADPVSGQVSIAFVNEGAAAAVLQVRSANVADAPRTYTVAAGARLGGVWTTPATGAYDLDVHGPNGFYRGFRGNARTGAAFDIGAGYRRDDDQLTLVVKNRAGGPLTFRFDDRYGDDRAARTLRAGTTTTMSFDTEDSHGWYDVVVAVDGQPGTAWQFAGHIENGRASFTDPAMGGVRPDRRDHDGTAPA